MKTLTKKQEFKLRMDVAKECRFDVSRLAVSVPIGYEKGEALIRVRGSRVIFSEELLTDYQYNDIRAAYVHGLLYILLRHEKRGSLLAFTNQEKYLWALASEACRSSFAVVAFGNDFTHTTLPFLTVADLNKAIAALAPEARGIPPTANVEAIYLALKDLVSKTEEKLPESVMGIGEGDGSSNEAQYGSGTTEGEEGGELEELTIDSAAEAAIQDAVKKAVSTMSLGLSHVHGEIQYFFEKYHPNYKDISRLQRLLKALVFGGHGKITLTNRRRRRNPCKDIVLFQHGRKGYGRVAVVADVSGSTSDARRRLFEILVTSIAACDRIDVYIGDTAVLEKKLNVRQAKQVQEIPDGGGTDMAAIMEEVDKKGYKYIVVISDGYTPWPRQPTVATSIYFPFGEFTLTNVPEWIRIA